MWWLQFRRRSGVRLGLVAGLVLLLVLSFSWSLNNGAVEVENVTDILLDGALDWAGQDPASELDYSDRLIMRDQTLILDIRLPRVILAALVGAALAVAGTMLQGVFRNPLADPGLIGIASGAAMGAVTAIWFEWQAPDLLTFGAGERAAQAISAFFGGLMATFLVYRLSFRQQRTDSTNLLLIGVAFNAIGASYVGMVTFAAGVSQTGDITFWTLGSMAGAFWRDVHLMLPFLLLSLPIIPLMIRPLNLLALGETEARHLGVPVATLRVVTLTLSALIVSVSVALVGIVGLVGLAVPTVMRLLFGPDHRWLIASSALGGAWFVIAADLFARSVVANTEIPLGIVTTLVGGPIFLLLVLGYRRGLP